MPTIRRARSIAFLVVSALVLLLPMSTGVTSAATTRPRSTSSATPSPTSPSTSLSTRVSTSVTSSPLVTESYIPTLDPWQVQSLTVPGAVSTYVLLFQDQMTTSVALTAPACRQDGVLDGPCSPDSVQAALTAAGASVVVTGGPSASPTILGARYTLTFAGPGAGPVHAATNDPGVVTVDCVWCLDTEASPPPGSNGAAVVLVHGGGFVTGARDGDGFPELRTRLEGAGYRTFSINYRLPDVAGQLFTATPFGDHCEWSTPIKTADCTAWLAAADTATVDLSTAVAWVRSQSAPFGFDPERVAVLGSSAGAIAALQNHYAPPVPEGRPAATVAVNGIMDVGRQSVGAGPALLFSYAGVDPAYAGSFLVDIDEQDHDEAIVARARATGNKVALRSYPGLGHGIGSSSPYYDDFVATTLSFLDEQLRPAAPPSVLGGTWLTTPSGIQGTAGQMPGHPAGQADRAVVGDFNGDGRSDIIWPGATGFPDMVWFGSADGVLRDPREWQGDYSTYVPAIRVPPGHDGTVADLNGDGCADVLWYDRSSGTNTTLWLGRPDGTFAAVDLGAMTPGLELRTLHDRGHADRLLLHDPAVGRASLLVADANGQVATFALPDAVAAGATAVIGDFNGDGRSDIVWQNAPAEALWLLQQATDPVADPGGIHVTAVEAPPIGPTYAATVADLDGDGSDDVIWYDAATGEGSQIWSGHPTGTFSVMAVAPAPTGLRTLAVPGPNHHDAILLTWPSIHAAALLQTDGATQLAFAFVSTAIPDGAQPIVADVNGDGRGDVLWST